MCLNVDNTLEMIYIGNTTRIKFENYTQYYIGEFLKWLVIFW